MQLAGSTGAAREFIAPSRQGAPLRMTPLEDLRSKAKPLQRRS